MTGRAWQLAFAAWLIAVVATGGALFIGEVMGQAPCELCWYQRIAMFPLAWILGVSVFRENELPIWQALPLALVGLAIAGFHNLIFFEIIPEAIHQCGGGVSCTDSDMTLFGLVPIPTLSLVAFVAIAALLLAARRKTI